MAGETQNQTTEIRPRPKGGRGPRRGGSSRSGRGERAKSEYDQKILAINRVVRVVRGGRRFSFLLVMVIGNRRGKVGVGVGKGGDVALAMEKAFRNAKKNLLNLRLTKTFSLPHEITAKFCGSRLALRPAAGRGLAAGGPARVILNLAGVRDVSAKFISKSKNKLNNARVTMKALGELSSA